MTLSRAMREIQSDATRVAQVNLLSAIEACEWPAVYRLCERLQELAQLGMSRHSIDNVLPNLKTGFRERDPR